MAQTSNTSRGTLKAVIPSHGRPASQRRLVQGFPAQREFRNQAERARRPINQGEPMMASQSEPPEDLRWLLEPPAPGEVHLHVAVGEGAQLTPELQEALEQLLSRLH